MAQKNRELGPYTPEDWPESWRWTRNPWTADPVTSSTFTLKAGSEQALKDSEGPEQCLEEQLRRQETQADLTFGSGVHNFFLKGPDNKYFRLLDHAVCCNYWALPLWWKQPAWVVNKWAWMCPDKTLWSTETWISCITNSSFDLFSPI